MKSAHVNTWTAIAAILIAITPAYALSPFLSNILPALDSSPQITAAYLDKTKYQPGDQMLITAEITDDWGIKKVEAQVENEKGWDTVDLIILAGNSRKATWQGAWKLHDTVGVKEYKTKIIATDLSGKTAEKVLLWVDPMQSHPATQIKPGAFQSGDYSIPGKLGIGADATAGDRLKVKATSGNAINAECTNCDAMYAYSNAGYSGYFTGGKGVKIENGGLLLPSGSVGIGTTSPSSKLEVSGGWVETSNSGDTVRSAISASNGNYLSIEAFNIDNSAKLPVNLNPWGGNVGIGTTSPEAKLDVVGANALLRIGNNADNAGTVGIQFGHVTNPSMQQKAAIFSVYDAGLGWGRSNMYFALDSANDLGNVGASDAKLTILNSGSVGIGTVSPIEKLEVNGNIKATAFLYSSDRRSKENIQKIDNPLEKIMMVDGVSFTWKESGEKGIGLTAQNVETVFPELVKTDNVSGMKSVEYGNLVAPLIEAVKEQQKIIKGQQVLIDNLQNQIEALKTEIKK